jgi:hypothetical protein
MHRLDYSDLLVTEVEGIEQALSTGEGEKITWYIPDKALAFVLRNYRRLAELGILEPNWMSAYLHASHFNAVPLSLLQDVFNTCDKKILQKHYRIPDLPRLNPNLPRLGGERFSLFRGCAGPEHRMGMSWLASLDKAIWYAAKHAAHYELTNLAVYAAVVDRAEIYCCGDFYDLDFIVYPRAWWRVDVPATEFRLDRPR